jgi:GNAT superfamily N-acetyltransferase
LITIRIYDPHHDTVQVYALWQQTLGQLWPLAYETFHTVTVANPAYRAGDHMVALAGDEIVGFLATHVHQGTIPLQGNLLLLLVTPTFQKQGIGRMLHEQASSGSNSRESPRSNLVGASITSGRECR